MLIGQSLWTGANDLNGYIHDIRIFNHVEPDIASLMVPGKKLFVYLFRIFLLFIFKIVCGST